MKRILSLAAVGALVLALGACGDDDTGGGDGPAPTPEPTSEATSESTSGSTSAPTPEPTGSTETDALCSAVPDEQLSDWAGRPVAAATQASQGGVTECTAVSEDGSIVVTWQTQDAAGSLDDEVGRADADGLRRSSVEVHGEPGALLLGARPGTRSAKVVAVLGDRSLYVDVAWLQGVGPQASLATLRQVALGVADLASA